MALPAILKRWPLLKTLLQTGAQGSYCYIQQPTHFPSEKQAVTKSKQKEREGKYFPPMPSLLTRK